MTTEYEVIIRDPNVEPATDSEPLPMLRQTTWRGDAASRTDARRLAEQQWDQTYGAGTQPTNVEVTIKLVDPVRQWAAEKLDGFVGTYAGVDSGPGDPVHPVREKARELLEAGPTQDDPFTVCALIAEALPMDSRAVSLW